MPPRLNKRQQRELEELEALGGPSNLNASSDDDVPISRPQKPAFSNFLAADDIASASDDGGKDGSVKPTKSRKKKKGKKKPEAAEKVEAQTPTSIPTPAPVPHRNEKKALKKARAKEKKAGDDELEKALAELSAKYPELQKPTTSSPSSRSLAKLLSVSLTYLDSEAEMRKFFGAKVVQANRSTSSAAGPASRRNAALQRSNLTRPQPSWWSASQREGLSIRPLTAEEVRKRAETHGVSQVGLEGGKWWTVEYSQRYKSMTKLFIQAVMSGHPDALWEVQRKLPWHADNLLQLAEVYRHREEYAQAVDFVDRAIFTYERAFIGAFNFTSGTNRLDFDRVENRPFFLAVHRQIADLQRRGCVRTAFEFARLLYALDPDGDPHGALLHLDMLALKAGMAQWLLDLHDHHASENTGHAQAIPNYLPGFMFARALALKMLEDGKGDSNHDKSTQALKEAMLSFPSIVPLLADKIDVSLPSHIRAHRDFKIETDAGFLSSTDAALHLLSHLYAQRSSTLWKDPARAEWFLSTASTTFPPTLSSSSLPTTPQRLALLKHLGSPQAQSAIHRHVAVLDLARLNAFVPRAILEAARALACDPLPPPTAISRYDDEYFAGTEDVFSLRTPARRTRRQREGDERMLAQVIPDPEVRANVVRALEGIVGQFPGGLAELMERIGPEALDDLIVQVQGLAMAGGGAPGWGMPGGFEVEVAEGHNEEADEARQAPQERVEPVDVGIAPQPDEGSGSESDEDDPSAIQRVIRNVLGRFWGGGAQAGDETSSDEEVGEVVDDTGVD